MNAKASQRAALAALLLALPVHPAAAALPEPVRAMVDAALATGNETKVRTIIEIARATNPDDAAELDTILAGFEAKLAEVKAAEAAARTARLRSARFSYSWEYDSNPPPRAVGTDTLSRVTLIYDF